MEETVRDARAGLLGCDARLLAERMGSLRMRWTLYDTALPADSTGRHPVISEAFIEANDTTHTSFDAHRLEASLSQTETSRQSEEHHETKETERSETLRKATGFLGGCSLIGLLVLIGAVVIYTRKKQMAYGRIRDEQTGY